MRRAIYVAGAYSAPTTLGTLLNIRRAIRAGVTILQAGHAPLVPHLDFQLILGIPDERIPEVIVLQEVALVWMERADAVFVTPGSENSTGTTREIEMAQALGIPVFHDMVQMLRELEWPHTE